MTPKTVHSRAYHTEVRKLRKQGFDDDVAKEQGLGIKHVIRRITLCIGLSNLVCAFV